MATDEDHRRFHLHLVSDATGETINSVARACLVQFEEIEPTEHTWSLIRTSGQMEKVLAGIRDHPGIVLFTIVNKELREQLAEGCRKLQMPCIAVLDPVLPRKIAIEQARTPREQDDRNLGMEHLQPPGDAGQRLQRPDPPLGLGERSGPAVKDL